MSTGQRLTSAPTAPRHLCAIAALVRCTADGLHAAVGHCDHAHMSYDGPVVLERLAATRWFAEHGEVALTAGLAFCLEKDAAAAQAFMALLRARTGRTDGELPDPDRWEAESPDPNQQRVDVAGWHGTGSAVAQVVVVEAKVS